MASRSAEMASAEAIVNDKVHEFRNWLASRALVPTIRDLRDHAERISRSETQRAQKKLASGEDPQLVIEQLAQQISNKFLHAPLSALNSAQPEEQEALLALVRRLYRLQDVD